MLKDIIADLLIYYGERNIHYTDIHKQQQNTSDNK